MIFQAAYPQAASATARLSEEDGDTARGLDTGVGVALRPNAVIGSASARPKFGDRDLALLRR